MAIIDPSAVWDFAREVVGVVRPDRGRTTATVTRIDADGTTWVTTGDGGEAPAASVGVGVSVGDTVTLEWDGSAMGIRSNVSDPAPPGSSIRRAVTRAQGVASAAQAVADAVNQHFFVDTSGIHVTEATQDEWDASHSGANVLINSIGQLFRDGLNNLLTLTTENGARALTVWDGLGNTAGHVRAVIGETITLGNASDGSVVTIDSDSMDMVHGTTEMLHFGYGLGAAESGTANAPYYTVGIRATNSTVGNYSVAEGYGSTASAAYSHAEGHLTTASGKASHAEGEGTEASGLDAHAEGLDTTASGNFSHAEGLETTASDMTAHAEGYNTTASEASAHAEGMDTTASGFQAHAEGNGSTASGDYSHAEGMNTTASGDYSHAQNRETVAASTSQTALGRYNVADANSTYAVIVGNGTDDDHRSNALTVDWDGNVACAGTISAARMARTEGTVTATTANATIISGVNHCWTNNATTTITVGVNLKSSLANQGLVQVATAPSGYRPPYTVVGSVYVTGQVVNLQAWIDANGAISVNNRSGTSVTTSANIYISFTFAP